MDTSAGDEYEVLREQLSRLVAQVTDINVARPMLAYGKVHELRKQMIALRPRAEEIVLGYEKIMDEQKIATMRDVMGTMPILTSLAHRVGSLRMLLLETSSTLDQKAAFSLAFFALYISISSVILSLILAL